MNYIHKITPPHSIEQQVDESLFWKKKTVLSYVLACLVLVIHSRYSDTYNYAQWIKDYISPVAVPAFFILSGVTFFRNYCNQEFISKVKSRFHTLIIPYLLWNTIWYLFIATTSVFLPQFYHGMPLADLSIKGVFLGIFHHGQNPPFWFVFNLII